jgi:hypothetical protein
VTVGQFGLGVLPDFKEVNFPQIDLIGAIHVVKGEVSHLANDLPLFVAGVHIQTELGKGVDEILGFGLAGEEVEREYFLYFSGEEGCAVVEVFEGNGRGGDFGRLFRLDLTQALHIHNVLGGDDLILYLVLLKRNPVRNDQLSSFHHEQRVQLVVLLKLNEIYQVHEVVVYLKGVFWVRQLNLVAGQHALVPGLHYQRLTCYL